ncbi:AbrB/MazE/SpoVT family DNA-binding domain-containing protein [Acidisoma silvae]
MEAMRWVMLHLAKRIHARQSVLKIMHNCITFLMVGEEVEAMAILTVTARGQVTFRKDVLSHLGIRPGDKIELDKLPDGRIALRAANPAGTIDGFIGLLAGKTTKVATIEEINEAIEAGWAGEP